MDLRPLPLHLGFRKRYWKLAKSKVFHGLLWVISPATAPWILWFGYLTLEYPKGSMGCCEWFLTINCSFYPLIRIYETLESELSRKDFTGEWFRHSLLTSSISILGGQKYPAFRRGIEFGFFLLIITSFLRSLYSIRIVISSSLISLKVGT